MLPKAVFFVKAAEDVFVVGKLADILEDNQAAKFTDKLYVALEDFQLALQKDKAKKRKVDKHCASDMTCY